MNPELFRTRREPTDTAVFSKIGGISLTPWCAFVNHAALKRLRKIRCIATLKKSYRRIGAIPCGFAQVTPTFAQAFVLQMEKVSKIVSQRTNKNAPEWFTARFQKDMWINISRGAPGCGWQDVKLCAKQCSYGKHPSARHAWAPVPQPSSPFPQPACFQRWLPLPRCARSCEPGLPGSCLLRRDGRIPVLPFLPTSYWPFIFPDHFKNGSNKPE